jgi:hypothetical protein
MFNLFSSACKRRSISPASAGWLNLDEPDITNVLLRNDVSPGNVDQTPFVPGRLYGQ